MWSNGTQNPSLTSTMAHEKLQISISAEGTASRVDIIGSISEWGRNNAVDLRTRCQELKDGGATSCHVYLMTVGGDCFQANEIVNILNQVFGTYTAEGGAIVASAGTYIGVCATEFTMAKNGQYMIHKPSGWVEGNETEVENYLKLIKNMTVTYYDAYKAKLKKPEKDFKAKWDGGDFWLTAQEAVEWGFASSVKDAVKIDQETAKAIQESGSPIAILNTDLIHKNDNEEMDLKAIARSLGMPEASTEDQINARLQENARKAGDYDTLKAETDRKEKEQNAATIKDLLDKGEKSKLFKADARANWQAQFEKDFEGTKALYDGLKPIDKPLSAFTKTGIDATGNTYQGKNFEQLQDEDPELLATLQDEDEETYNALFADWKKRNKIK